MEILSDPTPDMLAMPRFDDGAIDMQELLRRLAEQVVTAVMDAEADQLCDGEANSRFLPDSIATRALLYIWPNATYVVATKTIAIWLVSCLSESKAELICRVSPCMPKLNQFLN